MAENGSKSEELTLQDVQAQVEGLTGDIQMMHERLDSTITSSTSRFDQIDLAQTAAHTTLETITLCTLADGPGRCMCCGVGL